MRTIQTLWMFSRAAVLLQESNKSSPCSTITLHAEELVSPDDTTLWPRYQNRFAVNRWGSVLNPLVRLSHSDVNMLRYLMFKRSNKG